MPRIPGATVAIPHLAITRSHVSALSESLSGHAVPAMSLPAKPEPALSRRANPILPCHAMPLRTRSCHRAPNPACLSASIPDSPVLVLTSHSLPSHVLALPHRALPAASQCLPSATYPDHASHAGPFHIMPVKCIPFPAMPRQPRS